MVKKRRRATSYPSYDLDYTLNKLYENVPGRTSQNFFLPAD